MNTSVVRSWLTQAKFFSHMPQLSSVSNWPRNSCDLILLLQLQLNTVYTAANGPKKIGRINVVAVLTRVFQQENVWRFLPGGQKKVAVITK